MSEQEVGVLQPGQVVAGYRVEALLGRGGMGEVYRVVHTQTGAARALKLAAPAVTAEEAVRTLREGELLARIPQHPHVVRIHEVGQAQGRVYQILELLEGGDLAAHVARRPQTPPEQAAGMALQLCRGLAHVHAHGVLHRDLKPANVLVDEEGRLKLVDFGLARGNWQDSLTQSGTLLGTPAYMAPEQALGQKVGPPADVYAVCGILFELLTGRPPVIGRTVAEVLREVIEDPPPSPRALVPTTPPQLEGICRRGLAKDPGQRIASAEALAAELEAFLGAGAGEAGGGRALQWAVVVWGPLLALGVLGLAVWARGQRGASAPVESSPEQSPPPASDPSLLAVPSPSASLVRSRRELLRTNEPHSLAELEVLWSLNEPFREADWQAARRALPQIQLFMEGARAGRAEDLRGLGIALWTAKDQVPTSLRLLARRLLYQAAERGDAVAAARFCEHVHDAWSLSNPSSRRQPLFDEWLARLRRAIAGLEALEQERDAALAARRRLAMVLYRSGIPAEEAEGRQLLEELLQTEARASVAGHLANVLILSGSDADKEWAVRLAREYRQSYSPWATGVLGAAAMHGWGGVKRDPVAARRLLEEGMAQGNDFARDRLLELERAVLEDGEP